MAGEQKAKLSILRHYNFQSPIMYVYRVREGASNDLLGGQIGKIIIDMPGGQNSMTPHQGNTFLFIATS